MPQDIIVAIDGYSGCGKSSTAKAVARALGYTYIDSGAMYRAVTLYLLRHNIALSDTKAIEAALDKLHIHFQINPQTSQPIYETYLDGENVEQEIRGMGVSERVSDVSALPVVRKSMVGLQRKMGTDKYLQKLEAMLIVSDGRDLYVVTGAGDVLEPEHDVAAIGSGGNYALAAARGLYPHEDDPEAIARRAMEIASDICVYTNGNLTVESL